MRSHIERTLAKNDILKSVAKNDQKGLTTITKMLSQGDRWVFTYNNYNDEGIAKLKAFAEAQCTYMLYEHEVGEQQTQHLQGMCLTKQIWEFTKLKAQLPEQIHWEKMKGTTRQARNYCLKEYMKDPKTTVYESTQFEGLDRKQKQDRPSKVEEALARYNTLKEFQEGAPQLYCQYRTGIRDLYFQKCINDPRQSCKIYWFYGATGTGKTRTAVEFAEHFQLTYWISGKDLTWFDGYEMNTVAIIDDFRRNQIDFAYLLKLLDVYKHKVPIKGGFAPWNPKYIFITCPWSPQELYSWKIKESGQKDEQIDEDMKQLLRRIHVIEEFSENKKMSIFDIDQDLTNKHLEKIHEERLDQENVQTQQVIDELSIQDFIELASEPQNPVVALDASDSDEPPKINEPMKPEPPFKHMTYNPHTGNYNWPTDKPEQGTETTFGPQAPHNTEEIVSITDTEIIDITSTTE